jgi:hypothetical protein
MRRVKCTTKARITIRNPAGFRIPGVHLSVDVVNRGWWSVALLRSFPLGKLEPPELGFPAPQSSRTTVPAGDVGPRVNILS